MFNILCVKRCQRASDRCAAEKGDEIAWLMQLTRADPGREKITPPYAQAAAALYSEIGRPSVDPELMIRMLIVGYCYGLRSERKLTQEVELHLAYRWFCRLDLDDKVPHHSTFSENRLHAS
jgi:hypothetical protein